jgi:hypothetical protein
MGVRVRTQVHTIRQSPCAPLNSRGTVHGGCCIRVRRVGKGLCAMPRGDETSRVARSATPMATCTVSDVHNTSSHQHLHSSQDRSSDLTHRDDHDDQACDLTHRDHRNDQACDLTHRDDRADRGSDPTLWLPDELMIDILLKAPIETVASGGTCEGVCRRWTRLLKESSAIKRRWTQFKWDA